MKDRGFYKGLKVWGSVLTGMCAAKGRHMEVLIPTEGTGLRHELTPSIYT